LRPAFKKCLLCRVSKARVFLKYWLLPLIWMVVIFSASGDSHSFQHSSRILGPLLNWLFPNLAQDKVDAIVTGVRKCAHLTEYAVLAFLFWRALRRPVKRDPRSWSWRQAGAAVLLVAVYASTDEFHQRFVPSRDASVRDVLIDTTGAILGMLLLRAIWQWRRPPKKHSEIIDI
jgi:VanZ family protein